MAERQGCFGVLHFKMQWEVTSKEILLFLFTAAKEISMAGRAAWLGFLAVSLLMCLVKTLKLILLSHSFLSQIVSPGSLEYIINDEFSVL